jgi:hypothetical protein
MEPFARPMNASERSAAARAVRLAFYNDGSAEFLSCAPYAADWISINDARPVRTVPWRRRHAGRRAANREGGRA